MTTQDIAQAVAALCKDGKFAEAAATWWADDVVSIEATPGDMAVVTGRAAAEAKTAWWAANHEVHGFAVEGPFVNGDQFTLIFAMDVTPKTGPMDGQRMEMREVGLYTLCNGKIAEERFFY